MAYKYSGTGSGEASGTPASDITDEDLKRLPPRAHRHILGSASYTYTKGKKAVYHLPITQERFDPPATPAVGDAEGQS